jgi:hypothetical protein
MKKARLLTEMISGISVPWAWIELDQVGSELETTTI